MTASLKSKAGQRAALVPLTSDGEADLGGSGVTDLTEQELAAVGGASNNKGRSLSHLSVADSGGG